MSETPFVRKDPTIDPAVAGSAPSVVSDPSAKRPTVGDLLALPVGNPVVTEPVGRPLPIFSSEDEVGARAYAAVEEALRNFNPEESVVHPVQNPTPKQIHPAVAALPDPTKMDLEELFSYAKDLTQRANEAKNTLKLKIEQQRHDERVAARDAALGAVDAKRDDRFHNLFGSDVQRFPGTYAIEKTVSKPSSDEQGVGFMETEQVKVKPSLFQRFKSAYGNWSEQRATVQTGFSELVDLAKQNRDQQVAQHQAVISNPTEAAKQHPHVQKLLGNMLQAEPGSFEAALNEKFVSRHLKDASSVIKKKAKAERKGAQNKFNDEHKAAKTERNTLLKDNGATVSDLLGALRSELVKSAKLALYQVGSGVASAKINLHYAAAERADRGLIRKMRNKFSRPQYNLA